MGEFAKNTNVSPGKTQAEIKRTLQRYGAAEPTADWSGDAAMVGFKVNNRGVRMIVRMPSPSDLTASPKGRLRTKEAAQQAWEQTVRQKWRALLLIIKAKLEAVQSGIATFEEEFLPYLVLPGGATVGDAILPQLENVYKTGSLPSLVPVPSTKAEARGT